VGVSCSGGVDKGRERGRDPRKNEVEAKNTLTHQMEAELADVQSEIARAQQLVLLLRTVSWLVLLARDLAMLLD
jgi:hypothetical protein